MNSKTGILLFYWVLFALAARLISALTHTRWVHPDEVYQTVEFGNFIANQFMSRTQEVSLHLRNLSWPSLLSLPLAFANWMDAESVRLRVFCFQAFTGILDLAVIWSWWQLLKNSSKTGVPAWQQVGLGLLILPWFTVADSVRPSLEHLSTIAMWVTFGLLARKKHFFAGILTVGIGAFRYPSGLISVGILLALFMGKNFFTKTHTKRSHAAPYFSGILVGIFLFGLADWIYYGRPWESLWMYLQYNVWTGLSVEKFGEQDLLTYWPIFKGHWFTILLPLGLILPPFAIYGIVLGIKEKAPWAFATLTYLIGHLLVSHKETRFMFPLESLFLWASVYGLSQYWETHHEKISHFLKTYRYLRISLKFTAILLFTLNSVFFLRALWGETWLASHTYFEVNNHLKTYPKSCALITVRDLPSVYWPKTNNALKHGEGIPLLPVGVSLTDRKASSFSQAQEVELTWLETRPNCSPSDDLLLHLHKPDREWNQHQCEILPSGFLKWLSKDYWQWALDRHYASGTWYRCPASVLSIFKKTQFRQTLVRKIPKINKLPSLGVTGADLLKIGEPH